MNVLYLDSLTPWGIGPGMGRPTTMYPLLELTARGHKILYITAPSGTLTRRVARNLSAYEQQLASRGLQVDYFWMPPVIPRRYLGYITRLLYYVLYPVLCFVRLASRHRNFRPDIVVAITDACVPTAYLLSRLLRVPCVWRQFGTTRKAETIGTWTATLRDIPWVVAFHVPADHYIFTNDGTSLDKFAAHYHLPPRRVSFWRNGVDKGMVIRADPAMRASLAPNGEVVLLSVSRLARPKQIDVMIRAMPEILGQEKNVVLVIVGDGPERENLVRLSHSLGVRQHVRFEGAHPREKLADYYANCDVFISLNSLGFASNTVLEAMSCGACVLALDARHEGGKEFASHMETAYLFPEWEIAKLSHHLLALITRRELREQLGRAARHFIESEWQTWEERIGMEVDLIEAVAKGGADNFSSVRPD